MKKIHILTLGVAWMLGMTSSYAQSLLPEEEGGIKYWYDKNGGSFKDATSMGDPVFVGFDNFDESEAGFLNDYEDAIILKEGATEAYVGIYADGKLQLTGRQVYFALGYAELASASSSTELTFGGFNRPDLASTVDLPNDIVEYDEVNNRYVVNDPLRKYWLVYRAAIAAGMDNIYRGSEIEDATEDANGTPIYSGKYDDELMYLKDKKGKYYPVTSVDLGDVTGVNSYPMELVNCTKVFMINEHTYPTELLEGNGKVQIVNINSDVTVLPPFTNSVVNLFNVDVNNKFYTTEAIGNNSILCTKGADGKAVSVVALPKLTNNNPIDLPYYITSINEGALPTDAKITVVTKNGDLVNHDNNLVEWDGVGTAPDSYLKRDVALKLTHTDIPVLENYVQIAKSADTYGYSSSESQVIEKEKFVEFLSNVAGQHGLSYIDLSNSTFDVNDLGAIDMSAINANCLLFLPEGVTATGNNIVTMKNGVRSCANLNLVRQSGVSFSNPYEFTAEDVTVDYSIGANLVGLVLPFDYKNENVKKAVFSGFSGESILLTNLTEADDATEANVIDANTPFVAQKKDGADNQPIVASNVVIKETSDINDDFVDGWTMSGTYITVTNNGNDRTIYGYASNKLMRVNGATFKPFSGYFVCNNSNGAAEAKFRFVSNDIATGVDAPEAIFAVKAENGAINVVASDANVVIASVNGAVLFNGKVNGTVTKDVNPGVYVVNGKKVVVK